MTTTTTTNPVPTGQDLADLLDQNGAIGTWEENSTDEIERWSFPRFPGAENLGTCSNAKHIVLNADGNEVNHERRKSCEDFTPDPGNMYMSRSGLGPYDTDVETVIGWMAAPRNVVGGVNLEGDPGTGKTALIDAAATHAKRGVVNHLCTPDDTAESLFRRFVGEGKGDCINQGHPTGDNGECEGGCRRGPYTLGPVPRAAKHGLWLYMNEWMLLQDGVKPILYPLADGSPVLPEGNADGSDMVIHEDFRIIFSSNPTVRGASIPEPMGSRLAGTTLTVETSASMLIDLGIDEAIVQAWDTLGGDNLFRPAIREMRVANYFLRTDPAQAVSAFIGSHCPESDRKAVRDVVVGFLGGDIRDDGRLVVS